MVPWYSFFVRGRFGGMNVSKRRSATPRIRSEALLRALLQNATKPRPRRGAANGLQQGTEN